MTLFLLIMMIALTVAASAVGTRVILLQPLKWTSKSSGVSRTVTWNKLSHFLDQMEEVVDHLKNRSKEYMDLCESFTREVGDLTREKEGLIKQTHILKKFIMSSRIRWKEMYDHHLAALDRVRALEDKGQFLLSELNTWKGYVKNADGSILAANHQMNELNDQLYATKAKLESSHVSNRALVEIVDNLRETHRKEVEGLMASAQSYGDMIEARHTATFQELQKGIEALEQENALLFEHVGQQALQISELKAPKRRRNRDAK